MRADRPTFGPVWSASDATHIPNFTTRRGTSSDAERRISYRGESVDMDSAEGVDMTTSVAVADWIKRIVDDERRRDAARVKEDDLAAQKADVVRRNGRRLVDDLRQTVTRDAEAFRAEFPGDGSRDVVTEATADGGFVVRKPAPVAVSLSVTPNLQAVTMACHYRFTLANGLPPREDRFDVAIASDGGETLHLKHQGTGQVFPTTDALSEFLLVPVLTGRPR